MAVLGIINSWSRWHLFDWKKNWRGYAVGIITEFAWVWYSIVTKQWGFIFGSTIYISVYLLNINKWLSEAKNIKNRFKIHIFSK